MEPSNHNFNQFQVFRYQLNKLQTYKSSFQAWKCVSFGYALLASVLLFSKWHEVSTDLRLLNGIDQLLNNSTLTLSSSRLVAQASPFADQLFAPPINSTSGGGANSSTLAALDGVDLQDSGGSNATSASGDGGAPSSSDSQPPQQQLQHGNASQALVSHMQISLSREANGNQVLKQEVETFLGEFKSAKSTLGLSSLLVFVYIISWILMTLAVNDTRISNDVSLRNILLLSVFGAIDMAASIGFVMVRLIMFNARSGTLTSSAEAVLGFSGLRDAPSGLSSDQLTAFTALRLIAMRSCSAYIDIYVSVIVALLTILRLYAIIRAIAYYRFLRRFNDLNRNYHHQQQLSALMMTGGGGYQHHQTSEKQPIERIHHQDTGHHHHHQTNNGYSLTSPHGHGDLTKGQLQQNGWHPTTGGGYFSTGGHQLGATNPHHLVTSPRHNSMSATATAADHHHHQQQVHSSARATPIQDFQFISSQPAGTNFTSSQLPGGASLMDQQQQQLALDNLLKLGSLRTTTGQQVLLSPIPAQSQTHNNQAQRNNSSKQPQQLLLAVSTDDQQQQPPPSQQQQVSMRTPIRVGAPSQQQHVTLKPQPHPTNPRPSLLILTNNNNNNHDSNQQQQQHQLDPNNIWTTTTTLTTVNDAGETQTNENHLLQSTVPTKTPHHNQKHHQKSSAPNILLLNGRTLKLVGGGGYESSTGAGGGFESEPVPPVKRHRLPRDDNNHNHHHLTRTKPNASTSRANLLDSPSEPMNNSKPNSFTLLSASQLDRLSRKLLANATGSLMNVSSGRSARRQQVAPAADAIPSSRGDKYKLIGRYRPVKGSSLNEKEGSEQREDEDDEIERMADDLLMRSGGHTMTSNQRALQQVVPSSGTSSSGLATDSDDLSSGSPSDARLRAQHQLATMGVAGRRHGAKQLAEQVKAQHRNSRTGVRSSKNHQPHRSRASLASLRQTEEFNVKQPYLATHGGGGGLSPSATAGSISAAQKRDLLLEKYYYT